MLSAHQGAEFKRLTGLKTQKLAEELSAGKHTPKHVLINRKMIQFGANLAAASVPTKGQPPKSHASSSKSVHDSQLPGEQASVNLPVEVHNITTTQFERSLPEAAPPATCDAEAEILVPAFVTAKFKVYAERSFTNGIESLGTLLGQRRTVPRFKRELWVVECLFIPLQSGTKDTCEVASAHDSEMLVRKCSEHDWQVVGWIHTHPTFDAFLSSVDQHMQFMHQKLGTTLCGCSRWQGRRYRVLQAHRRGHELYCNMQNNWLP